MKISFLKTQLNSYKGHRENWSIPLLGGLLTSYSATFKEIQKFTDSFLAVNDRDLTCEEELRLGDILFVTDINSLGDDLPFINQLKTDLFSCEGAAANDLSVKLAHAASVFEILKEAVRINKNLMTPKCIVVLKSPGATKDMVDLLSALNERGIELDDEMIELVKKTVRNRSAFATALRQLHVNQVTNLVVKSLNDSQVPLDKLILAVNAFYSEGFNKEMPLVELVLAFDELHRAGIYDRVIKLATTNMPGAFITARANLIALLRLTKAGRVKPEYIDLLENNCQHSSIVTDVIIFLADADLLDSNMNKLQRFNFAYPLLHQLKRLKEEGYLNQDILDFLWEKLDSEIVIEIFILGQNKVISRNEPSEMLLLS